MFLCFLLFIKIPHIFLIVFVFLMSWGRARKKDAMIPYISILTSFSFILVIFRFLSSLAPYIMILRQWELYHSTPHLFPSIPAFSFKSFLSPRLLDFFEPFLPPSLLLLLLLLSILLLTIDCSPVPCPLFILFRLGSKVRSVFLHTGKKDPGFRGRVFYRFISFLKVQALSVTAMD